MKARMDGWWMPSVLTVEVSLKNIRQAEALRDLLRSFEGEANKGEANFVDDHIEAQKNFGCRSKEYYDQGGLN